MFTTRRYINVHLLTYLLTYLPHINAKYSPFTDIPGVDDDNFAVQVLLCAKLCNTRRHLRLTDNGVAPSNTSQEKLTVCTGTNSQNTFWQIVTNGNHARQPKQPTIANSSNLLRMLSFYKSTTSFMQHVQNVTKLILHKRQKYV